MTRIVVANFKYGEYDGHDDTKAIVDGLGMSNIDFICGDRPIAQSSVFELAQERLLDCSVVFISDADEFLLRSDQARCVDILMNDQHAKKIECMVTDYSKSDATEAFAQRTHLPVVAFKPRVVFSGNRWCEGESRHLRDMNMHHFGYCLKEYEWKRRNLWYPGESADRITCTMKRKMTPPQELIDAIAISPS